MANDIPPPPPPAPLAPIVPKAAYVEEYNEEDQASRPETRQSANISTKRSKPDVAILRVGREELSDSGYSSHTAATPASSAPSSLESKSRSYPPKAQQNTAASKRKPTVVGKIYKSRSHSPEKAQIRTTQSKAKKDKSLEAPRHQESKPKAQSKPLLGGLFKSTKPSPARISQDALPVRPRATTSQADRQARPLSYHAGAVPVYVPPQPLVIDRQPLYPPPLPIFSSPSYPPPQHPYFPPLQQITPPNTFYPTPIPSYTPQHRPPSRQWGYGQHTTTRPQSMYDKPPSQPMVEYGEGPVYTTIAPDARPSSRQPVQRERPQASPEEYPAHPEDYYRMPPPGPKKTTKPKPEQRPPMVRHAHTTSDAHAPNRSHRSGHEGPEVQANNQSSVKQSFVEHERSRRPAAGPPKRSHDSVPSTHGIERGAAHINTDNKGVKEKRRASVYGHESLRDLEGSVEAYQASHRPLVTPNAPSVDTLARTKKPPGSSSDTSSRHSGRSGKSRTSREGSDVKSRRPSSEVKNRNDNDGLAMRFNASQGVNIQMKGGIEGRTISLRQSRDGEGEMELGIGSRGRTVGSRPPISGREKSRRRYSDVDGQGVTEVERPTTSSRPPRGYSYRDERGMARLGRATTASSAAESIQEEYEPRVIRERIITRSRSRRSSRSGYGGFGRTE